MEFIPTYLVDQLSSTITAKKTLTEMLSELESCIEKELEYYELNLQRLG